MHRSVRQIRHKKSKLSSNGSKNSPRAITTKPSRPVIHSHLPPRRSIHRLTVKSRVSTPKRSFITSKPSIGLRAPLMSGTLSPFSSNASVELHHPHQLFDSNLFTNLSDSQPFPLTIAHLTSLLASTDAIQPEREAWWITCSKSGIPEQLLRRALAADPDPNTQIKIPSIEVDLTTCLTPAQCEDIKQAIYDRVISRKPLQYVLGDVDFCQLTLKTREGVLIPRPDTEHIMAWLIHHVKHYYTMIAIDQMFDAKLISSEEREALLPKKPAAGSIEYYKGYIVHSFRHSWYDAIQSPLSVRQNHHRLVTQLAQEKNIRLAQSTLPSASQPTAESSSSSSTTTTTALATPNTPCSDVGLTRVSLSQMISRRIHKMVKDLTLYDICSGSGNIALSLASQFPAARVIGLDFDPQAIELSRENAKLCQQDNCRFWYGDVFRDTVTTNANIYSPFTPNPTLIEQQKQDESENSTGGHSHHINSLHGRHNDNQTLQQDQKHQDVVSNTVLLSSTSDGNDPKQQLHQPRNTSLQSSYESSSSIHPSADNSTSVIASAVVQIPEAPRFRRTKTQAAAAAAAMSSAQLPNHPISTTSSNTSSSTTTNDASSTSNSLNERLLGIFDMTILASLADIIISNPPYITSEAIHDLDPEVTSWENLDALRPNEQYYRRVTSGHPPEPLIVAPDDFDQQLTSSTSTGGANTNGSSTTPLTFVSLTPSNTATITLHDKEITYTQNSYQYVSTKVVPAWPSKAQVKQLALPFYERLIKCTPRLLAHNHIEHTTITSDGLRFPRLVLEIGNADQAVAVADMARTFFDVELHKDAFDVIRWVVGYEPIINTPPALHQNTKH